MSEIKLNEQIPEWLRLEAERKYPGEEPAVYLQRQAYIAGALSRSGGVWVKCNNRFPNETKHYFLRHKYDDGRWHGWWSYIVPDAIDKDVWLHLQYEWLDESPAADKGDAIDGWISIQDKKPNVGESVLTFPHYKVLPFGNKKRELRENESDYTFWRWNEYWDEIEIIKYITHWRPLPQPPQSK